MSLKEYHRKRNFRKTPEPSKNRLRQNGHRFVIQKHAASRLHYDFRLELGGILKSWAVPKGVPFKKGERRLAVQVEDHPLSYINFEGVIPPGQYGGGIVMVWDRGTFVTPSKAPLRDLAAGKLHITLHGQKLKGEWYLVRLKDEMQWLLIKGEKNLRPPSARQEDQSALSGHTMKQLSHSSRQWSSVRAASAARSPSSRLPDFIKPMKATLVEVPPPGDWFYELKFDGYRALTLQNGSRLCLLSRNEKDLSDKFPLVTAALQELALDRAVLDGEIVALDKKGLSSFQLLQAYALGEKQPPLVYYVFDLLRWQGRDLRKKPIEERKRVLTDLIPTSSEIIRLSASVGEDATSLLRQAKKLGLEGLIGKRKGSVYETGRRSGAWIKLKLHHEQEFVIGGSTDPGGSRPYLGALLVGVYEDKKLLFTGKVGTGFTTTLLRSLSDRLKSLSQPDCPFSNLPETRRARYGQAITAAQMKLCHWVEPKLVAQIRFSEWTRDGKLRQPVFLGLREDKAPREVVREKKARR
jgi:bifunctional non-homologous end joining protein LigD